MARVVIVRPNGPLMVRSAGLFGKSPWPLKTSTGSMDAYEFVAETLLAAGHAVTLVASRVAAPPAYAVKRYVDAPTAQDVVVALQTSWQNTWLTDEKAIAETVGAFRWIATGAPVVFLSEDPSEYMTFPDPAAWRRMAGFESKRAAAEPIAVLAERVPRPIVELTKTPHLERWNAVMEEVSPPSLKRRAAGWSPRWWSASCVAADARPGKFLTPGGGRLVYVGHPRSVRRCHRLAAIARGLAVDVYGRWDSPESEKGQKNGVFRKAFGDCATPYGVVNVNDLETVYDRAAASLVTVDGHTVGLDWIAQRFWEPTWRGCPVVVDRAVFGPEVLPGFEAYVTRSPEETAEQVRQYEDPVRRSEAAEAQRAALGRYRWQSGTARDELAAVVAETLSGRTRGGERR